MKKEYLQVTVLSLVILFSAVSVFNTVFQSSSTPREQVAAVSDFDLNLVASYLTDTTGTFSVNNSASLTGMAGLTLSLWVKTDSLGRYTVLSKRHSASPWYSYNVSIDTQTGNRVDCAVINSSSSIGSAGGSANTFTANSWHHIACVYDGSTVSVYTDGSKNGFSANLSGTVFNSDSSLIAPFSSSFNGAIGNVRIYKTALSPSQISELYALGAPTGNGGQTGGTTEPPPSGGGGTTPPPSGGGDTPPPSSSDGTVSAISCSSVDVQNAIDTAQDGDTVLIPAGTCTWKKPALCNDNSYLSTCAPVKILQKSIILKGAGQGNTNISVEQDSTNWNRIGLYIQTLLGKPIRITGMTLSTPNLASYIVQVDGTTRNLRIDHVTVNLSGDGDGVARGIYINGYINGVIDHSIFNLNGHNQAFYIRSDSNSWKRPSSIGKTDNVFIEDSQFIRDDNPEHYAGAMDGDSGARVVFRHNSTVNSRVFYHGPEIANLRGGRSLEVYNNNMRSSGYTMFDEIGLWSGTGVFHDNAMSGSIMLPIMVQNRRSCSAYSFGQCNGSSQYDANNDSTGYACLDQVGRSTDANSSVIHPQVYEPMYQWNNTYNGKPVTSTINSAAYLSSYPSCQMTEHIKAGRDYFDNTPRPGYVAYTYPHPLTVTGFTSENPTSTYYEPTPVISPFNPTPPSTQPPPPPAGIKGDFNKDGVVNSVDFSLLAGAWNQSNVTYDLNKDTTVNTLDYSIMAQNWTR